MNRPAFDVGNTNEQSYAFLLKRGSPLHRNDFITQLSQVDNDCVVVEINGVLIDVEEVRSDRGSVVAVLNPEDLADVLQKIADGRRPLQRPAS